MVTAVDIEHLAGDQASGVVGEEGAGDAHVIDVDERARRRLDLGLLEQGVELGMPEAAQVASGPGEIAWTRMPLGPSSAAT